MAAARVFVLLIFSLLLCLVKCKINPEGIVEKIHIEVNLISGANRDVSRGFMVYTLRICSPASSCLNVKRLGFLKRRLNYYSNCTASFNPSLTTLIQSGDIHPLPGPVQRNICTDIRCLYMNARSLVNKTEQFQTLAVDMDSIFAVETWLKPHVLNCELLPGLDFAIHRRDRSSRVGDGVLLAVNNTIKSFRRKDLEGNAEILACELRPNSRRKILAIVFYRPPNTNSNYLKELKKTLRSASDAHFDQVLLCGDFNLPNIDWSNGSAISGDEIHNDLAKLFKDYYM